MRHPKPTALRSSHVHAPAYISPTCPFHSSPGDGPQSPSSSSGDTFGSTVRAVALRREQAQKLSETLTALRRRIEGALDACATDQAPGSFEAEAAA